MMEPRLPAYAYWVVPSSFAAGARPTGGVDGFGLVIDLTEGGADGTSSRRLHRPIVDFGVPPEALVLEVLDAVDAELATGGSVYVHCGAGLGRTGTIVGCWLARHGTTGEAAIDHIASLRAAAGLPATDSPETAAQREFVAAWPAGR